MLPALFTSSEICCSVRTWVRLAGARARRRASALARSVSVSAIHLVMVAVAPGSAAPRASR